ncbi:MAG TPA: vanadium-dependent haloperoxidase [Candidatus Limnocylindrales bacterium]|nr:vanadium-dependent haloperoxidase [Candidatus Limnocylindrales bacterium]
MNRPDLRPRVRRGLALITVTAAIALAGVIPVTSVSAAEPAKVLLDWNQYAIEALSNPNTAATPGAGQTPPVGSLHLAMVQLAVYDAVNAIDRSREPYLSGLPRAPRTASKSAAAATAAHHVLVGLVPALPDNVKANLNALYAGSLAGIASGSRKNAGIRIGAAVAKAMLAKRANDGRYVPYAFTAGSDPGEWRPELPSFASDPFAWVSNVKPFALRRASQVRSSGPLDMTSAQYATEFNEVKALGSDSLVGRTDEQTALARFYTANPMVMMYRSFREIATARGLSIARAARLFGMVSVSSADAMIGCWDDKDYWNFWRPITAIREAEHDGNPATAAQSDWLPFFPTPPYPDHPSGYNCFAGAMVYAAKAFFGTDFVAVTLTNPTTNLTRSYDRLTAVLTDTIDARIYLGFHFRTPDVQGAQLGRKVAAWVNGHFFERVD